MGGQLSVGTKGQAKGVTFPTLNYIPSRGMHVRYLLASEGLPRDEICVRRGRKPQVVPFQGSRMENIPVFTSRSTQIEFGAENSKAISQKLSNECPFGHTREQQATSTLGSVSCQF